MATAPQSQQVPTAVVRKRKEMEELLNRKQIPLGSTILEPKKKPGSSGEQLQQKLITNMHLLKITDGQLIYRYKVTVKAVNTSTNRSFPISDQLGRFANDDFRKSDRREKCATIYQLFKRSIEPILVRTKNVLYYDLASALFSIKKLELPQQAQGNGAYTFQCQAIHFDQIPSTDVPPDFLRNDRYEFIVEQAQGLELRAIVPDDLADADRSLLQFLDIAASQKINLDREHYINYSAARSYLLNPGEWGFTDDDCPYFAVNQSFLGIGSNKGARIIEGERGFGQVDPALVIQVKKSAFHISGMTVFEKAKSVCANLLEENLDDLQLKAKCELLNSNLVGLYVEPRYGPSGREFRIDAIPIPSNGHNSYNAENTHLEGTQQTVQQYFREKYGIELEYPQVPLLISRRQQQTNYFPMELCFILDNQRVKGSQQKPDQISEMIQETAVSPSTLLSHNQRVRNALQLVDNEYLTSIGVQYNDNPFQVNGRVIGPPSIAYASQAIVRPNAETCGWMPTGRNILNGRIDQWVAYALVPKKTPKGTPYNDADWREFVKLFTNDMRSKGIVLSSGPRDVTRVEYDTGTEITRALLKEAQHGAEFALVSHPDGTDGDVAHHAIKTLESITEMVTQAVRFKSIHAVVQEGKRLTLGNCIQKTNVKMGGLNYALHVEDANVAPYFDGTTLFIGFAMNQPMGLSPGDSEEGMKKDSPARNGNGNGTAARASTSSATVVPQKDSPRSEYALPPPSCIGWTANIGLNHQDELIGNFFYQEPRREEKIEVIAGVVCQCIKRFREREAKKRTNKQLQRIIILRNACPEGQFEYILKYEIPLVKYEMGQLNCEAKLTVMVPNKKQDVRFIRQGIDPEQRASQQNIRPGTVIDTGVVHPKLTDFYLNSHVALQGTAQTPHYAVLFDENKMSMDTIQGMVNTLCFNHQIINSPTSLPSPVYIAEEYAKRGRNIYNYWSVNGTHKEFPNPRVLRDVQLPQDAYNWPPKNYHDLNMSLGFEYTKYLRNIRSNA